MSELYRIEMTKYEIKFIGRTREGEFFMHEATLKGNCDDEKWFDLICEYWNNDNHLYWDEVQKVIEKEGE